MGGLAGGGISLGTLWVEINAKVDEAIGAIQRFTADVGTEIEEQKKKWDKLGEVGQGMTTLGASLTAALTVPIAGIGAASIAMAGDFEASMNKITAVSGTTGAELESLRAQAMQLGADTKFSAQEAADGMGNLAAAGFNTQQIMAAMPGVLDLAAAGELSVARAAETTTDTLAQFNLKAEDAGRVADILAKGAAASSISVAQMAQSTVYAGSIAANAGMSIEEVATAITLMGNAGIKADMAGTSLRGIIGSLIDPSKRAAEELDRLGVTTTDAAGKMLPLDQIFLQLKQSGADTASMFTIFDNASASAAATLMKSSGPAWAAMTQEMTNSEGAARKMADTLNTGMKGAWEQMKGSIETVGIALGTSLLPLMTKVIEAGTKFVNDWILPAVQAFGQLDPALQAGIIAFGLLAAAIGPIVLIAGQMAVAISALMPVLTAIAGAIGTSVLALGGWAIAIAAVIAALVALGAWVYSNWDQIVAFLSGIWDNVEKAWTEVWTGIVGAITGVWEAFKGLFGSYWEPIVKVLTAIWSGITAIWKAEWELITGAVKAVWTAFVEYADKIFGPAVKFLGGVWDSLKGAWNDAGKAAEEAKKKTEGLTTAATDQKPAVQAARTEVKNLGTEIGVTGNKAVSGKTALKNLGTEVDETGKKHEAAKTEVKKFNDEILLEKLRQAQTEHNKLVKEIAAYEIAAKKAGGVAFDLNTEWEKLTATSNLGAAAIGSINVKLPVMNTDMQTAITRTQTLDGAFKTLGVTSSTEFAKVAADAAYARDIVLGSDQASDFDKKTAVYKALQAQIAASKAAGTEIPADQTALLQKLKTELETKVPEMKAPFEGLATSVSTVITNFAQDISKALWDGDMSWGEKGKSLLKSLGQAVASSFIEPATAAIGNFVKGALADLLGGKGFGGVWDSIKGIGSAVGGIFGGGGGGAGVGQLPGVGGAGGGAGAIGGAIGSGISGVVGAVGGIASAVSGIIGNFQMAGMNKTLDLIEKEVRYSQIHLSYILANTNDFFHRDWWKGYQNVADIRTAIVDSMEPQLARAAQHIDFFKQLAENDFKPALYSIAANTNAIMGATERIAVASERSVSMNLYGTDPDTVAARIAQQLRMQGGNG